MHLYCKLFNEPDGFRGIRKRVEELTTKSRRSFSFHAVLAETHLIAGAFTSLGSKRATNLAVWDHTNSQWLDLHSVVERVSINIPLGTTFSENGFDSCILVVVVVVG
jgi:long-subunit acyl-CoA synthetase (AMP-forming)